MEETLFKIATRDQWARAEREGVFRGAPVDLEDGFIHLSLAHQVRDTVARHFAGVADLLLIRVDPTGLGAALRHEPSRGGQLFPHLYASLPLSSVVAVEPLVLGADGLHVLPDLEDAGQALR